MNTTDQIIKIIKKLPPVSQSLFQILKVLGNKNYSFQDIAKIIEYDPILTARILKLTNSSSLGLKKKFDSVKSSIPYLGEKAIISLAVNSCAGKFYNQELNGYLSEAGELWRHSIMTAIVGKEISIYDLNKKIDPNQVFTAGILHDVGKAIMSVLLNEKEKPTQQESGTYLDYEEQLTQTDHCQLGAVLADQWGLPDIYKSVIRFHHTPALAPEQDKPLVYAVHLSDIVAMEYGMGTGSDALQYTMDPDYNKYFDLDSDKINVIIIKADDEYNKINELFQDKKGDL